MEFIKNNWEGIIALCAMVTSVFATVITFGSFRVQRKHNILSVKPLLHIAQFDYENCIKIIISNNGVGPAIVKSINVRKNEHEVKTSIFHWLPEKLPGKMNYKEYLTAYKDFVIKSGATGIMLEVPINPNKDEQITAKENIRAILRNLTVNVEYEDIYQNKMDTYSLKLNLYSRNDHIN
jgi:hypothetical protein